MMELIVSGTTLSIDLIEARRLIGSLETRHQRESSDVFYPSKPFLQAIADWLMSKGLKDCTHTGAWQFWRAFSIHSAKLRKENQENADIAYWFKVNPFDLTPNERIALLENLPRCQAQQVLQNGNYNGTDHKSVYALVLAATGDREAAEKARRDAMERYLETQLKKR